MPRSRRTIPDTDQPSLPLEVEDTGTPAPRRSRSRPRSPLLPPVQLALEGLSPPEGPPPAPPQEHEIPPPAELSTDPPPVPDAGPPEFEVEPQEFETDPPDFASDPFAEIPGFEPASTSTGEYVLLPASLRGKLDLRELFRFLGSLRTVVRDFEGGPEVEDGGVRLRGPEGGAWVYPEARQVRLVTDGSVAGPVADDLIALCRWLESRAGLRLYSQGEGPAAGTDRSLDPWETFSGK